MTVVALVHDQTVSVEAQQGHSRQVLGPAIGQPRLQFVATANYDLPWWRAASLDVSAVHVGTAPESVDNAVYTPAFTGLNIGGRYKFTVLGENSTLRLQVQNALGAKIWSELYTPGVFRWPGPRAVFAYITTDLQ